ncbi:MAG: MotA/TolQ/ExbB proton channel family protein [Acidobacteriota bacterium]
MWLMLLQAKGPMFYINQGGWVMWPLTGLLFLGLCIALTRIFVIWKAKTPVNEFMQKIRSLLLEKRLDDAIETTKSYKGSIANVFEAALLRLKQRGKADDLEKIVENKAIQEVAHLEKGLWLLALISNVAPILGFLGTVVGMIRSFDVLAKEGMNNPSAVAEGISVALITTAGGLIVAVVVLPFYNWLTTRISTMINEMETASNFLFETLDEMGPLDAKA